MDKNQELAMHCKHAIEKAVVNAGGVFAYVNQLIAVADEESTTQDMNKAAYASSAMEDELENEYYYLGIQRIEIEDDGALKVQLFAINYETDECGVVQYANGMCHVAWDADNDAPQSVMTLYQIPLKAIAGMEYTKVWDTFVCDKGNPASCRNIIHSEATPVEVIVYLSQEISSDDWLYQAIEDEHGCGATYLFVNTPQAGPIAGFEISDLLKKAQVNVQARHDSNFSFE